MGWRYPKSKLRDGDVVAIDSLNDGFAPFAQEAQGRLNEQNLAFGAIRGTTVTGGLGEGTFTYVSEAHLEVDAAGTSYVTTSDSAGTFNEIAAPTQGAMLTPLCFQPSDGWLGSPIDTINEWTSAPYPLTPSNEGKSAGGVAAKISRYWFAWTIPGPDIWYTIGGSSAPWFGQTYQTKSPLTVEGVADQDETLFVSMSLQCVCLNNKGPSFGIFVNGNLISENMSGSGDASNDPVFRQGGPTQPSSQAGYGAQNPGPMTRYMGFPVCLDAVVPIAAGPFTVEIKVKALRWSGGIAIGSRELVVWAIRG